MQVVEIVSEEPPPIRRRVDRIVVAAAVLGALGLAWRVWLTAFAVPPTNSDEATMGLAALHIAEGQGFPIYFYGQHYMGTLEAYLAAPLVSLLGPTVWAIRLAPMALYLAYLAIMFVLVRRLYSAGFALFTVALLALASDRIARNQLIGGGGYPETPPMVAGLLLLTLVLITRRRHWGAYAAWGLLFGLIVWTFWLPAPYLAAAAVVLLVFRVVDGRRAAALIGGTLAGAAPLLIDNLRSAWADSSISVFLFLNGAGTDAPLWERIVGGAWYGLPMGMGLCAPSRCEPWSLWWSPVIVLLLVGAIALGIRQWRQPGRSTDERAKTALHLVLAIGGLLTLVSYVRSPSSADSPLESARYLILLGMSLPAALWPLWRWAIRWREPAARRWAVAAAAPIAALTVTMVAATASVAGVVAPYQIMRDDQDKLIAYLDGAGLSYVHTEYWVCNWIPYLTNERITCGVLNDNLEPGLNRYAPYWRPEAEVVVAQSGSPMDLELARRLPGVTPQQVGSFRVYPGIAPGVISPG